MQNHGRHWLLGTSGEYRWALTVSGFDTQWLVSVCVRCVSKSKATEGLVPWGARRVLAKSLCASACSFVSVCNSLYLQGAGLWPQGLVCPCTSNWRAWDPRAATGQPEYLSPAAGGTHIVHKYTYIHMYICNYEQICPPLSERGSGWGSWCCVCSCECFLCLSVISGQPHIYVVHIYSVHMYLVGTYLQPHNCLRWGHEAAAALPFSGCQIWSDLLP